MGVTGEGALKILGLGEAQASKEDRAGSQFKGDAGDRLRADITRLGLNLDRDFYLLNAVRCATFDAKGNSRTPTDQEIALCHAGTWELIRELKPTAIWLWGLSALHSYLLDKDQDKPSMARWRGWAIPDQELKCWVFPMYHPSFPMRRPKDKGLARLFFEDMRVAVEKSTLPFFEAEPEKYIRIIRQEGDIVSLLRKVLEEKPSWLALDFETTGLKPHREGHDIKHAAICWGTPAISWAFPTKNPEVRNLLGEIIKHPEIGLSAHNAQFEDLWSRVILNVRPQKWVWDSEVAAHVLDDRAQIISLEFQAAVRYGDWHFKKETSPYLKPPQNVIEDGVRRRTGANDFNSIDKCPQEAILARVGKDALYGNWLTLDQIREFKALPKPLKRGKTPLEAYKFFQESTLALGDTLTDGGLVYDVPYFEQQRETLSKDIVTLKKGILSTPPAKNWKKRLGTDINPGSDDQVRKLLFQQYQLKPLGYTESGDKESVTHATLQSYSSHPEVGVFCRKTLEYNKKTKLLNTYIEGYRREAIPHPDLPADLKVVYPFIGVTIPRSYRSSSRSPNLQNVPIRDLYSKEAVRKGLLPWPGQQFLAADYGSHEFVIAACYSRDQVMIKYIKDGGDPHGDQALRLFLLRKDQLTKDLRQITKGGWVFAMQYGSSAAWEDYQGQIRGCAPFLWEESQPLTLEDGTPLHTHLFNQGIKNFADFIVHCREEENIYWRKFAGLKAWHQEWLERYERDGMVPMLHGFRRQGLLTRNEIYNSSIQGTGYHFIQESYNELNKIRKEEGWQSRLIGEIHDEIVASVQPDELDYLTSLFLWVMRDLMQERYSSFLVVPLKVEFKATEIDHPWFFQKDFDYQNSGL